MSNKLLKIIHLAECHDWQYYAILDESQFDLSTNHKIIWFPEDEALSEMEKPMNQAKMMLIIA
jgi:hypothetical protein